jgi:hypothetical protein
VLNKTEITTVCLKSDCIYAGTITDATVCRTHHDEFQLELGIEVDRELLGERPEDGTELVSATQTQVRLHLDTQGKSADIRRGIARDSIERITGVRLQDSWDGEDGYQRLLSGGENSLVPRLVGQQVFVRTQDFKGRVYANLHFPRQRPREVTREELLARLAKPY